LIAPSGGPGGT